MQPIELILGNRSPRGIYRVYAETAAIAPAANAILGVFRWTSIKELAIPLRVWTTVNVVTAITAQRVDPMRLFAARAYTVRDATNATAVAVALAMQKLRTSMSDSMLGVAAPGPYGNVDVASAAAGVSGGTKTVDTNPMGSKAFSQGQPLVAIGAAMEGDVYNLPAQGGYPFALQALAAGTGEGLLLQWGGTTLATGTVTVGFGVEWAEMNAP